MRIPENVQHDIDIAYRCTWSLLNALHIHNKKVNMSNKYYRIRTVIVTGFAIGIGQIDKQTAAHQMIQAMIDFREALDHKSKWSSFEWPQAHEHCQQARKPA